MNVVFMGTPDFSVPSLEAIVKDNQRVSCVVTQPDKPRGRGNKVSYSPVKEKAMEYGIPVEQPYRIKKDMEFIERLKSLKPDVIVVVAFGQILPPEVLAIPALGCINVHASLLPHLRGAAPINWAIINGDRETGITTMFMDEGLDTGDMLLKQAVPIDENETAGQLHDKLKLIGGELIVRTLHMLESGNIKREPQDGSLSTYAPMLNKDTGRIIWDKKAGSIKDLVRGTNPWPVAYTYLNDTKLKIWNVETEEVEAGKPGLIWKVDKSGIHVYAGDKGIIIKEVQIEGGKRVDAHAYTLGHPVNPGLIFEY